MVAFGFYIDKKLLNEGCGLRDAKSRYANFTWKPPGFVELLWNWIELLWIALRLSMSSRRGGGGGGRQGIGRGFDRSLWPGGRAFELSCFPGSRDIWIFVHARNHKSFPGVGNFSIFDLTFLPRGREFDSNVWENVKIPPYVPPSPPPAWHW